MTRCGKEGFASRLSPLASRGLSLDRMNWRGTFSLFCRTVPRARLRGNSCARQLRRLCFFGSSPKVSETSPRFFVPLRKSVASLWEQRPLAFQCPEPQGQKRRFSQMYLNSVQIIGFIGKDPEGPIRSVERGLSMLN